MFETPSDRFAPLPDDRPVRPPAPGETARRPRFRLPVRWVVAGALLLAMLAVVWLAITAPLSRSLRPVVPPTVTLLAADGRVIARRGAEVARPVDVRRLPDHVADAFIAIEDRRFRSHWGVDPRGVARAAWHNLRAGGVREGGSTITQQLAKLVFLKADRTAGRKARELMIAFWLEAWLSKDAILSRYLSNAYFGDNVYGLRAAARHYFDVDPERLSVGQSAMLAGLMKAPSRLAPSTNLAGARTRQRLVVAAMVDAGLLDAGRARRVRPAALHLRRADRAVDGGYFADWVIADARATREDDPYAPQTVRTTLDPRLQRAAEAAAGGVPAGLQVAIVAMKPNGRVVAMVGGRRYADSAFNRATQARRQPGSTFKLFTYLAALRAGMTPGSTVLDRPITIAGWSPANADGRYRGEMSLREAFARSSNVAAVRLAQQVGPRAVVRAARDLGIASPLDADAGIALGTSATTLIELTAGYAAVADGAYPVRPRGLADAEPGLLDRLRHPTHSFGGRERAMLRDLLSASVREGTGRAAALDRPVFGKTGTSQDNRDALFVGFADGLVAGVWIGRDDDRPMRGIAGGGLPAKTWRRFMAQALGVRATPPPVVPGVDPDAFDAALDLSGLRDLRLKDLGVDLRIGRDGLSITGDPDEDGNED